MATERVIDLGAVELTVSEARGSERGGDAGRPLMLVHGYTGARGDFGDWLDALADEGWHVVAPDLRGHGASTKPDDEDAYSFALFAADVLALADRLGWQRFVLLGHSMGGMIAQETALTVPERVEALVLMDTSHAAVPIEEALVEMGVAVARTEGMAVVADALRDAPSPLETEAYRRTVDEREGYAEMGDRNLRASSAAMYAAMALQITRQPDRLASLSSLSMPTLVLVGEQDEPFLEPSRRMAETIPGARLAVLAGGGHSPQFEAPEAWWDALSSFLREVAATSGAQASSEAVS